MKWKSIVSAACLGTIASMSANGQALRTPTIRAESTSTLIAQVDDTIPQKSVPSRRDPTLADEELRNLLTPPASEAPGIESGRRSVPLLVVRARVLGPGKRTAALLSIGERFHKVTPGHVFDIDGDRTVTVVSIDQDGVTIELSPEGIQLTLP